MRSFKVSLFLGLGLLAVLTMFSTGQAQVAPTAEVVKPPTAAEVRKAKTGCRKLYTRKMFHRAARSTYKFPSKAAKRRRLAKIVRCQHSEKSERNVRRHLKRYKRHYHLRAQILAVTPYGGPNGTRWAIPWSIVACESTTGSWSTINSIGAVGPYQFLDKPIVWPVRTRQDKLAHHRLAAYLWQGGAGSSHWAECL